MQRMMESRTLEASTAACLASSCFYTKIIIQKRMFFKPWFSMKNRDVSMENRDFSIEIQHSWSNACHSASFFLYLFSQHKFTIFQRHFSTANPVFSTENPSVVNGKSSVLRPRTLTSRISPCPRTPPAPSDAPEI